MSNTSQERDCRSKRRRGAEEVDLDLAHVEAAGIEAADPVTADCLERFQNCARLDRSKLEVRKTIVDECESALAILGDPRAKQSVEHRVARHRLT